MGNEGKLIPLSDNHKIPYGCIIPRSYIWAFLNYPFIQWSGAKNTIFSRFSHSSEYLISKAFHPSGIKREHYFYKCYGEKKSKKQSLNMQKKIDKWNSVYRSTTSINICYKFFNIRYRVRVFNFGVKKCWKNGSLITILQSSSTAVMGKLRPAGQIQPVWLINF